MKNLLQEQQQAFVDKESITRCGLNLDVATSNDNRKLYFD